LLLDECVTRHLTRDLAGHDVHTVEDARLKGLENGELLKAASGSYEALINGARNIPYQQNIAGLHIAILILGAKRNSYARLKLLVPRALSSLESKKVCDVIQIEE
jgi:hypothetical protein